MQYVRLGQSGLKVSRIGLGMMSYGDRAVQAWALAQDGAGPIVARAAEAGVTFFDTADTHSDGASEEITGRLLRRKVRYLGASTMAAWQFGQAQYAARSAGQTAFVSMQNRYNLVNREDEREMIPLCRDLEVHDLI
jgi:aryl-alcohol dehydrogenase-like predicted oxidoreductase